MNCKKWSALAFVFLGVFFLGTSHAQKMYRCGSAYQDRPCEGAQDGKEVRPMAAAPTSTSTQSTDNQCKQRGLDAQKIVWARQSGVLAEKLIADVSARGLDSVKANEEKALITDVYQKQRGSAPEVRAAIEADCIEAKKQASLAAAMIAAGIKLQGKVAPVAANPVAATSADAQAVAKLQGENVPTGKVASAKSGLCSSFNARIDAIRSSQRAGGSVATMESLNRQRSDIDAERSRAGC